MRMDAAASIKQVALTGWDESPDPEEQLALTGQFEDGDVLLFPQLSFAFSGDEARLLTDSLSGKSKNISYNSANGVLDGAEADKPTAALLRGLLSRYASTT